MLRMRYLGGGAQMGGDRSHADPVTGRQQTFLPGGAKRSKPPPGVESSSRVAKLLALLLGVALVVLLLFAWQADNDAPARHPLAPLDEVRWGLIGCGDVTERKSGPALSLVEHSRLVLVMRRNASLAQDYARRHGVARWTSDASEVINDPEVNAVYIATPPRYHAQYAVMAMRAGKAVYVEKPMGRSYDDSHAMLRESVTSGVPLFVAYYRRALPHFEAIRRLLQNGTLGAIRAVHVQYHRPPNRHDVLWASAGGADLPPGASLRNTSLAWRPDPEVGGRGGYFRDKASHQLDLLQHWLGPIAAVSGTASSQARMYPSPDTFATHFRFAARPAARPGLDSANTESSGSGSGSGSGSAIIGTGSWCFAAGPGSQQEYGEVVGDRGRVRFQFFLSNRVEVWDARGERREVEEEEPGGPKHVQQPLIASVVAALRGEGACASSSESAARTSLLIDHIVEGIPWP